jgi:hypothetical protein
MVLVLDECLPSYDHHEVHSTSIGAPPEIVLEAACLLTAREVPLFGLLMALRAGPRIRRLSLDRPIVREFERSGFARLVEGPDEIVWGGVGRFWTPTGGLRRVGAGEFRDFAEPGFAKAAFNFRAERRGQRTVLTTETRILATDDGARRSFRRYWRVVQPGSAVIRLAWLRAIRRRAERAQRARSVSASSRRSTSSTVV